MIEHATTSRGEAPRGVLFVNDVLQIMILCGWWHRSSGADQGLEGKVLHLGHA